MPRLLRPSPNAVQGRAVWVSHPSRRGTSRATPCRATQPGMSYGNGLMHVGRRRPPLSAPYRRDGLLLLILPCRRRERSWRIRKRTISAFAEYRPRLLTRFAVDALTDALPRATNSRAAAARSSAPERRLLRRPLCGPAGAFEVRPATPLTIVADGRSAPLQLWTGEIFRSPHPVFRDFSLMFERSGGAVARASWGPRPIAHEGSGEPFQRPTRPRSGSQAGISTTIPGTALRGGRARRQALDRDRDADDAHRRQSVARRKRELVARTCLVRRLHRRPSADLHILRGQIPAPRSLGLRRAGG